MKIKVQKEGMSKADFIAYIFLAAVFGWLGGLVQSALATGTY